MSQVLFADWGIIIDEQTRNYVLHLNRFDGAKMPYVGDHYPVMIQSLCAVIDVPHGQTT